MPVIVADTIVQGQVNKAADVAAKILGDLALCTVHLFTNDYVPVPQSVLGSFTEAVFTGYAAQAVAGWGTPELPSDGSVGVNDTTVLEWVGPSDASGQTVYGYYLRSAGAGTPYIGAYRFPFQVPLAVPTDVLDLVAGYFRQ